MSCLACALTEGRADLPGGRIHESGGWIVDHCVGPLGVGTLIVRPRRHLLSLAELTVDEAAALGTLLHRTTQVVRGLARPDQVYVCLWSHDGTQPVHVHFVVQPVTTKPMRALGAHGPGLQAAMFARGELPPRDKVEAFAERTRELFAA